MESGVYSYYQKDVNEKTYAKIQIVFKRKLTKKEVKFLDEGVALILLHFEMIVLSSVNLGLAAINFSIGFGVEEE